jgi:hypothetical protein
MCVSAPTGCANMNPELYPLLPPDKQAEYKKTCPEPITLPSIDNSIPEGYVMVGETLIKLYDEEFYKNSYADIKKEIKPKDLGKISSIDI